MAKRFIKIYEQITNWEWFRHPNTLCLFIYFLLKANYKDIEFHGRTIRRGQLVTSLHSIATSTGLSIRQARTALSHLISTGEVTNEPSNQYSIITVVKYDEYQNATDKSTGNRQAIDKQLDRQTTSDATPSIEYIEDIESNRNIESLSSRERGTAKRFTPPTKEEIFDFCLDNHLSIDVDYLYDYYAAKGWKIGKDTMKDWKAAVRNWARREKKDQPAIQTPARRIAAQEYKQRDYSEEDRIAFRRMMEDLDL